MKAKCADCGGEMDMTTPGNPDRLRCRECGKTLDLYDFIRQRVDRPHDRQCLIYR